jgi:hypothetical protein
MGPPRHLNKGTSGKTLFARSEGCTRLSRKSLGQIVNKHSDFTKKMTAGGVDSIDMPRWQPLLFKDPDKRAAAQAWIGDKRWQASDAHPCHKKVTEHKAVVHRDAGLNGNGRPAPWAS